MLSVLIWLPVLFGVGIFCLPRQEGAGLPKMAAMAGSALVFLLSLWLLAAFDPHAAGMQQTESFSWLSIFGARYALGVDGISLWLVVLNALVTFLVALGASPGIPNPRFYFGSFLVMEGLVQGAFLATDALLFYVFWEAMLIPMYFIIGVWGGQRRVYAAIKFFLYTLVGSFLLLAAFLVIYAKTGDFSLEAFRGASFSPLAATLLFLAFFIAFAIKVPMWPVHTWLPDAHVEAPTGGSMILAAILLKLGAYGFLRFALPILPQASQWLAPLVILLSLVAIVYVGFVAMAQPDMKKLVAYSSIAHMGFVTLGIFLFTPSAIEGAIIQMISHGFVSAALFFCIGVLYDRAHTRDIAYFGGIAAKMPVYCTLWMLFAMANTALPGTSGFVGEWMVLMEAVRQNIWIALLAASTMVLSAAYTLWMVRRVMFGPLKETMKGLSDVDGREFAVLLVLAAAVLYLGLNAEAWVAPMRPTIETLVQSLGRTP